MAKFNINDMNINWLEKQLRESVAPITYQTNDKGMASLRLSRTFIEEHIGKRKHVLVSYVKDHNALCLKAADMSNPQEEKAARRITTKSDKGTGVVNFKIGSDFPQCLTKVGIQFADFEKHGDIVVAELKATDQPAA